MDPFVLSIAETAKALKIGRTSVYKLISLGKLKTVRILSRQMVTVDSVRALGRSVA